MKTIYQVNIKSVDYGSYLIAAHSEEEAKEIADKKLEDGDTSWNKEPWGGEIYVDDITPTN